MSLLFSGAHNSNWVRKWKVKDFIATNNQIASDLAEEFISILVNISRVFIISGAPTKRISLVLVIHPVTTQWYDEVFFSEKKKMPKKSCVPKMLRNWIQLQQPEFLRILRIVWCSSSRQWIVLYDWLLECVFGHLCVDLSWPLNNLSLDLCNASCLKPSKQSFSRITAAISAADLALVPMKSKKTHELVLRRNVPLILFALRYQMACCICCRSFFHMITQNYNTFVWLLLGNVHIRSGSTGTKIDSKLCFVSIGSYYTSNSSSSSLRCPGSAGFCFVRKRLMSKSLD